MLFGLTTLSAKLARLRACHDSVALTAGPTVYKVVSDAATSCGRIHSAIIEVELAINKHRELERKPVAPAEVTALQNFAGELSAVQSDLEELCHSAKQSAYMLFGQSKWAGNYFPVRQS